MKLYMQTKIYYIIILLWLLIFPLKISPAQEKGMAKVEQEILEVGDKSVLIESYTVKHGDHLWQLLRERGLLDRSDFRELLAMLKKLNQSLPSLSDIEPGDKLLIPHKITPKVDSPIPPKKTADGPVPLRIPRKTAAESDPKDLVVKVEGPEIPSIKGPTPSEPAGKMSPWDIEMMRRQLGEIFIQMGEEWVERGQHFIPLASGTNVELKAESYPIINLSNGNRVIVDLKHDLPEEWGRLITSSCSPTGRMVVSNLW